MSDLTLSVSSSTNVLTSAVGADEINLTLSDSTNVVTKVVSPENTLSIDLIGSVTPSTISALTDVSTTGITDGQILAFSSGTGQFSPTDNSSGALSLVTDGDDVKVRLTNTPGSTSDVLFKAGTGISLGVVGSDVTIRNTASTGRSDSSIQDVVGAMFSGNTETRISATYDSTDGTIDLVVDDMTANTQLTTEEVQDIVGAMFSGNTETRISATYEDGDGTIDLVVDDMTADTQLSTEQVQDIVGAMFTSNTETRISATYEDGDGTIDLVVDAIPVDLTSDGAGTIHANNVPTLNQSTTGNAATATALATARAINGVNFDGTAAITVTAAGSTLSDTVPVSKGGTGATTLTGNGVLTGNGTGAIVSESDLTFASSTLTITGQRKIPSTTGSGQFYGDTVVFGSGPSGVDGSIEQGKLYYLDSSQQWEEADADAAASATGMLALAIVDDSARFMVKGLARHSNFVGFTTGDVLYVSTTAGGITKTAPTGSADIVRIVGYCTDGGNREIYFDPSKDWVELS